MTEARIDGDGTSRTDRAATTSARGERRGQDRRRPPVTVTAGVPPSAGTALRTDSGRWRLEPE